VPAACLSQTSSALVLKLCEHYPYSPYYTAFGNSRTLLSCWEFRGKSLLQKKRNGKYRLLSASRASGRVDGRFGSCLRERTRGGSIWLRARVKPPNCSDRQRRERVRVHLVIAARECRSNGTVPSFLYPSGTCAPIEEVVEVHGPTHLCPSSTRPSHKLGTRDDDGVGGLHPHGG
jgi:hypothetical protein